MALCSLARSWYPGSHIGRRQSGQFAPAEPWEHLSAEQVVVLGARCRPQVAPGREPGFGWLPGPGWSDSARPRRRAWHPRRARAIDAARDAEIKPVCAIEVTRAELTARQPRQGWDGGLDRDGRGHESRVGLAKFIAEPQSPLCGGPRLNARPAGQLLLYPGLNLTVCPGGANEGYRAV